MQTSFVSLLDEVRTFWRPSPDKPEETAERTLCALWSTASGRPVSAERASEETLPALDAAAQARLRELIELRRSGVPLAHLTQRQFFLGLELIAGGEALIPRKETEILGRAALAKLQALSSAGGQGGAELTVIDVCTGSGNLALACAWYRPNARVFGSDITPEAVDLAQRNADRLRLASRVEFRRGDLLEPFDNDAFLGRVDLLSCNPPYISSAKLGTLDPEIGRYEPRAAFDGGAFGVSILMKLLKQAPRFLRRGGWLAFEVGLGQGPGLLRQLERNAAFAAVEAHRDAAGEVRAILARAA
ncbi:MAG: N5-glutamine methyltransferase family protein [Betaproteobacteria bacterium]